MVGHLQDFLSLHDPPGRASSLGRPNPISYPVSYLLTLNSSKTEFHFSTVDLRGLEQNHTQLKSCYI